MSSRFSCNSEAFASELLENLQERFKSSTTHTGVLPVTKGYIMRPTYMKNKSFLQNSTISQCYLKN